jgi:hypothetical protein
MTAPCEIGTPRKKRMQHPIDWIAASNKIAAAQVLYQQDAG